MLQAAINGELILLKNGCTSSYSETGTFEVYAIPTNPTLNGIADICNGNNATVTWTTAAGETYDVDFWNGSAWQTPDTVGSGTATENTPGVASGYKWRINTTKNGCSSTYTETGTFEVFAIPTNPTLNGVADICSGSNATVTWTTAAGETYDVDFWNGSIWQTPDTVGSGTATENTPGVASGYKWRINTTKNGCSSTYTETGTFEVFAIPTNPTLNGVADICSGTNATVTWTTAASETYDVDFWNGSAWQTPDTVGSGTATENAPTAATGYKWRINTTKNGCSSTYTETATFDVTAIPAVPSFDSVPADPQCDTALPYTANITWTSSANTEYFIQYRVDAGAWTDANGGSWYASGTDNANISLNANGDYDFQIKARSSVDNSCGSAYSTASTAFTLIETPEKVTLAATPVNDDPDGDGDVTYNWTAVADTTGVTYEIIMDSNASPSTSYKTAIAGTATNYAGHTTLSDDTYYWKIRAVRTVNGDTCNGTWSDIDSFVVSGCTIPSSPGGLGTSPGDGDVNFAQTFSWNTDGSSEYLPEYKLNTSGVSTWTACGTWTTNGSCTATQSTYGSHQWRVRVRQAGNASCEGTATDGTTYCVYAPPTNLLVNGKTTTDIVGNETPDPKFVFTWDTNANVQYKYKLYSPTDFQESAWQTTGLGGAATVGADGWYYWEIKSRTTNTGSTYCETSYMSGPTNYGGDSSHDMCYTATSAVGMTAWVATGSPENEVAQLQWPAAACGGTCKYRVWFSDTGDFSDYPPSSWTNNTFIWLVGDASKYDPAGIADDGDYDDPEGYARFRIEIAVDSASACGSSFYIPGQGIIYWTLGGGWFFF